MLCKYCGNSVTKVTNLRGVIMCMGCYNKKAGPEERERDRLIKEARRERIEWMHREKYI